MALYKGDGSKSDAGSYRPISMTSILIRTFEHLIHPQLVRVLDPPSSSVNRPSFLSYLQFGFRKKHATEDAILYLYTALQSVVRTQTKVDGSKVMLQCPVLFLDIQKAFDRVDHAILLDRLHDAGITGKAWLWIRSFLSQRRMRTVDASHYSSWQQVGYGVPQGCVLSPLLFLVFINTVQRKIIADCPLIAPIFFADDGAIGPRHDWTGPDNTFEQRYMADLTKAVDHLQQWCDESRMRFGAKKTQLVVFSGRKQPDTSPYQGKLSLCNFVIDIANSYLYLGVHLQSNLHWRTHFNYVLRKARVAAARIARIAQQARDAVHFNVVRTLVTSYLIPTFAYGILFWGRYLTDPDRRALQSKVTLPLRCALNLPRTTHQLGVLEMCGVPTIKALTLRAQLAHHLRTHQLTQHHPAHPTWELHGFCLSRAAGRAPHNVLAPDRCLNIPVHTAVTALPDACFNPALAPLLPNHAALAIPPLAAWQLGVRYWLEKNAARRATAKANYKKEHLTATLGWSTSATQRFTDTTIRHLRDLHTHMEWKVEHGPRPAPGARAGRNTHTTDSPLTRAKDVPGLCPFLSHLSIDTQIQRSRRARLLAGRTYTGSVRLRFQAGVGAAAVVPAPSIDPSCTHAVCMQTACVDTIDHMLLHCHRHTAARMHLTVQLAQLYLDSFIPSSLQPLPPPSPPLSLSSILCSSPPPLAVADSGARPPRGQTKRFHTHLSITNAYLDRITAEREAAGVPPLDTG